MFNAINDGNYVIIFPDYFQILEATGELHEDVDLIKESYSLVYT